MPIVLTPLVLQIIQLGLQYTPELIAAAQAELELFSADAAPTAEQQAAIDAALEQAHEALQAAQPAPSPG